MTRLGSRLAIGVAVDELTYQLDRIEQSYGNNNVDVVSFMIEKSLKLLVQSWRRDIIAIVGPKVSV